MRKKGGMLDEAVEPLRLRGRPFITPKKVLNDPNDLKVFKDFKDLNIPNKFDIPLAYSYLCP